MRTTKRALAAWAVGGAVAVAWVGTALAAKPVEYLTAFAVDMSNMAGRTRSGTVDIIIDRWSAAAERDQLTAALREGGPDALLRNLRKLKEVGRIRSTGSVGYPLRFAWQTPQGEGRRIILATDRPVSFLEARDRPRTVDYPFMLIDLRMNAKNEGEGKLLPLAKVTMDEDHVVEIENYASEPVRLGAVRKVK